MNLTRYIPVKPAVEAVQLSEENLDEVIAWINSVATRGFGNVPGARLGENPAIAVSFHSLGNNGSPFHAKIGDWITLNGWGGFKKFTPTGFARSHTKENV